MATYTPQDFAKLCDIKTNYLSVQVSRGKVIVIDGMIDGDNETNRAFYERRKAGISNKPTISTDLDDSDFEQENYGDSAIAAYTGDIMDLATADKMYKHFLALRTQKGAELDQLKIEKLNGLLIPTELVKMLVRHLAQNWTRVTKESFEDFVTLASVKYKIPDDEAKTMRKNGLERINTGIDKAIAESKKGLNKLIDDYSMTKGRGERG